MIRVVSGRDLLLSLAFAGLAGLLLGCPSQETTEEDDASGTTPGATGGELEVGEARALVTGDSGAVYLAIRNGTDVDDVFVGASSPDAAAVEPHETIVDGDMMRMAPAEEGFAVPAGGSLALEPGGKHLMLIGPRVPDGGTLDLTLHFETAEDVVLAVPVTSHAAAGGMGHQMDAMDHADPGHHDDEPHGGMVHGEAEPGGPVDHEAETDPDPMTLDEVVEEPEESAGDAEDENG